MVTEIQYDHKKKEVKIVGRDASGYPIYYEKIFTLKELKCMVSTLID